MSGHNPGFIHMEPLIKVRNEPLVVNLPPIVMDANIGTPRHIHNNEYTCSSVLPPPCKELYDTISKWEWKSLDGAYEWGVMDNSLSDLIR